MATNVPEDPIRRIANDLAELAIPPRFYGDPLEQGLYDLKQRVIDLENRLDKLEND